MATLREGQSVWSFPGFGPPICFYIQHTKKISINGGVISVLRGVWAHIVLYHVRLYVSSIFFTVWYCIIVVWQCCVP